MAQSELGAALPLSGRRSLMMLTDDEVYQIEQCRKIVSLRDDILAGTHPRIKVPPHLAAKVNGTSAASSEGTPSRGEPSTSLQSLDSLPQSLATNSSSFISNSQQPPVARPSSTAAAISKTLPPSQANGAKTFGSATTKFDPILLEKSESLIKAEINLQRQKIEKALREQVEQQPRRPKGHFQDAEVSERGLDVSDILSKAQELVQTAAAAAPGFASQANNSAASDSFDEATYYSSRHDTPQLLSSPRLGNEPTDSQMSDIPTEAPPAQDLVSGLRQPLANFPGLGLLQAPSQSQSLPNHNLAPALISPAAYYSEPRETQAPAALGLPSIPSQVINRPEITLEDSSASVGDTGPNLNASEESGEASRSEESSNERTAVQLIPGLTHQQAPPRAPVVRAHQLPLIAPQPAHVSPLAVAHQPTIVEEPDTAVSVVPPSQVAALRGEPGATSPESSPHGHAKRKAKKKKKKQDKAERQAVFTPALIKAEPRSTSPLTAPTFARPAKRARQTRSGNNSVSLDQTAREQLVGVAVTQRHPSATYGEFRDPRDHGGYERQDEVYARPSSGMVIHPESRYDQGYVTEIRPPGPSEYARPPQSVGPYSTAYVPAAGPQSRSVSQVIVDRGYREQPRFYTEDQGFAAPVRVRPEVDRDRSRSPMPRERQPSAMGPQRAVSTVVVDAYGREYIEPSIMRQSAAPMLRQGEPEVIYERAPIRAASVRPARDIYDADGVIYRRASPTFGPPRRVITQPEYAAPEYRSYRQRDYPDHPMPQPTPQHPQATDEYVQIRHGVAERMVAQELPREYAPRAASVRPVEAIRYEVPRGYSRVQSVRPEGPPPRDYAPIMQQDSRGGMAQPQPRPLPQDYGAPPAHPHVVRREYGSRPLDQYYENVPARPGENVTYIDRPPPPAGIVYMDEQGREVYR